MGFCKLKHGECEFAATCERAGMDSQRARGEWCERGRLEHCSACAYWPKRFPDPPPWGCARHGFSCWREGYLSEKGKRDGR